MQRRTFVCVTVLVALLFVWLVLQVYLTIRSTAARDLDLRRQLHIESEREQFRAVVNKARADLLHLCPSVSPSATFKVGVAPGSFDIVITTVNFTTSSDPTSPTYVELNVDRIHSTCEPRATIDEHEHGPGTEQWGNIRAYRCDHTAGAASCCVRAKPDMSRIGRWGTCEVPSAANNQCRCRNCFDYRIRRRALQFNEVKQQLRSFEANGLFVQSEEHPDGVVRKIFIVYNEGRGNNPPPTWLRDDYPHVTAVPHKTLFLRHDPDTLEGYPTGNRNSIVALIRLIPGLESDWILYIEDDIYLNRPLSFHGEDESYFTKDGRAVSHLTHGGVHEALAQPKNGYTGAMWSTNNALAKRFGNRGRTSRSLVSGLEHEVIGLRRGEGRHTVYWLSRCVLDTLYKLWGREYNDTIRSKHTANKVQHSKDMSMTTHAAMFLEDLGLAKNVPRASHMAGWHTNSQGGTGPGLEGFVQSVCYQAWKKTADWLQVQGDGISDEYIGETSEARGDLRFAWQSLSEYMWPVRSAAEIDAPFGSDNVYKGMALREHGEDMCAKLNF